MGKNVGSRGLLRTVEAMAAIAITMIFLNFVIPSGGTQGQQGENFLILKGLEPNQGFRSCALQRNATCLNETFLVQIPNNIEFTFNVSSRIAESPAIPTDRKVTSDSIFMAGNGTHYLPTIVRLYYWPKG